MPPQLLFDISGIDLSRLVCDQEEIRRYNPQRGDMEHLNGIVYADKEKKCIVGYKDIRPDEFWVYGHIPGRPLFPGVLMIEVGAQLASFFNKRYFDWTGFIGFGGVTDVRFRAQIVPPARMYILGLKMWERSLIQRLTDLPLAFIDVETNGRSARSGDRVIEIGILRVQGGRICGEYQQLIDPRRRISPIITQLTGITPAMCVGMPTFAQQAASMLPFLSGAILVGHNVMFDLSFLYREMRRARISIAQALGKLPILDTLRLARRRFGRGGNSLGILSRRLGIEPDGSHRALADAKTTHRVFHELVSVVGGWDLTLADVFFHQGGPRFVDCQEADCLGEAQSSASVSSASNFSPATVYNDRGD
jgi:3-hydroxyacyl-[acyl-carrier-protein] dehydratase